MVRAASADVDGLRMHYLIEGEGPLVVLLHGWPQTSHCWRHVLGPLARDHTVVAPDLRGYGRTDKPRTGYDKRTMAADVRGLVDQLGNRTVSLVGHDRGGRVAHRYALDHPDEVERLAVLDIAPTRATWQRFDMTTGTARRSWHWAFHLQPDLPERLAGADVGAYLGWFFEHWTVDRAAVAEGVPEYVRAFSQPGALRAGFDDYRAAFPDDADLDDADFAAGRRVTAPVLALWGAGGLVASMPVVDVWREYAADVTGAEIPDCGHFLAEERPDALLQHLDTFLAD